jgi:hypothetical protein
MVEYFPAKAEGQKFDNNNNNNNNREINSYPP